jgi:hypothetical protein
MEQIILECVLWIVVNWIILRRHCLWDWFHAHSVAKSRESQYTGREAMSFVSCRTVIIGHVDCMYPHKLTSHYRETAVTSYSSSHVPKPTMLDVISYTHRLCCMIRVLTVFLENRRSFHSFTMKMEVALFSETLPFIYQTKRSYIPVILILTWE